MSKDTTTFVTVPLMQRRVCSIGSFSLVRFHPLEYVVRLGDHVERYRSVIRSSWLFGWLGCDSGPDRLLSQFVADMAGPLPHLLLAHRLELTIWLSAKVWLTCHEARQSHQHSSGRLKFQD
jgi:hypothetical protein